MALFQSCREPVHLATTLRSASQISLSAASVRREVAAHLDDLTNLHVQRLDRVRRIYDFPDIRHDGVERNHLIPGRAPECANRGYFFPHGLVSNASSATAAASVVGTSLSSAATDFRSFLLAKSSEFRKSHAMQISPTTRFALRARSSCRRKHKVGNDAAITT